MISKIKATISEPVINLLKNKRIWNLLIFELLVDIFFIFDSFWTWYFNRFISYTPFTLITWYFSISTWNIIKLLTILYYFGRNIFIYRYFPKCSHCSYSYTNFSFIHYFTWPIIFPFITYITFVILFCTFTYFF